MGENNPLTQIALAAWVRCSWRRIRNGDQRIVFTPHGSRERDGTNQEPHGGRLP